MDSNLPSPVSKNQRVFEESNNVDRISCLPDELICRILSLLPTKDAVCSAILSTRWKNIWVSIPVLDFDIYLLNNKDQRKKFIDFFDRLLNIRLNVRTEKFFFCCSNSFDFAKLYSWLNIIMMSDLNELDLEVSSFFQKPWELPSSIFRHKILVVLKLNGKFLLDLPSEVSLPSLKTLFLKGVVYVNDASIQHMLCGCPVLEDLTIERNGHDYAWNYVISVHSLKRMTLTFFGILPKNIIEEEDDEYDASYSFDESEVPSEDPKHTLSLHTPNLEYLRFVGEMPQLFPVTQMPFLCKADIRMSNYDKKYEEYETGQSGLLLEATPNVCHLSLSGVTQRNLGEDLCRNGSMFQQLIHLELGFNQSGPLLLPYFLTASPNLRSISLPEGISKSMTVLFFNYKWIPPKYVPECLLASLKKVEIQEPGCLTKQASNLIKYFLKNAMVLEKMTVFVHHNPFHDYCMGVACYSSKIEELINYPRGSPSADLYIYETHRS